MNERSRWRGLKNLIVEATVEGARAVEKVHLATVARTFAAIELIPAVEGPARPIHALHDHSVKRVYETIRAVAQMTGDALDVVIHVAEQRLAPRDIPGDDRDRTT